MTEPPNTIPRIAIACGGTGGHLFPGLAVARQLALRGCAVTLLISPKDVDQRSVRTVEGIGVATLPAVALQRGSRMAFCGGFVRSFLAARRLYRSQPPHAALSMGGFTGVPPVLAARLRGARTFLHESNTIPGRANRALATVVDAAFVGFPQTADRLKVRHTLHTGTPVRQEFQSRTKAECCTELGLDPARPVVLIMGGSQGAHGINELLIRSLPLISKHLHEWQWVHLTGPDDADRVRAAYAVSGVSAAVHPFLDRMEYVLGAADVAVSRAGASTLAELAALRLPAVLVPFPAAADNHQFHNARALEECGAARMLEQHAADPGQLVEQLQTLCAHGPERAQVQAALGRWHAPRAAADIAAQIIASLPVQIRRSAVALAAGALQPSEEPTSFSTRVEVTA